MKKNFPATFGLFLNPLSFLIFCLKSLGPLSDVHLSITLYLNVIWLLSRISLFFI